MVDAILHHFLWIGLCPLTSIDLIVFLETSNLEAAKLLILKSLHWSNTKLAITHLINEIDETKRDKSCATITSKGLFHENHINISAILISEQVCNETTNSHIYPLH